MINVIIISVYDLKDGESERSYVESRREQEEDDGSSSQRPCSISSTKSKTQRNPVKDVRRSSRVVKNPRATYKEVGLESLGKPTRTGQRKYLPNRVYASETARNDASKRAYNLQSSLKPQLPSFVKELTHSHVTKGFWLGLPKEFCLQYLPHHIAPVYLVDENDEESETKYLFDKNGLSAGWRGFAIHHGLLDGDALVFQQIHPTTFKVYIIRAYDQANNDSRTIGKENHDEINKKQEENVAEASSKLRGSRKRKRGGYRPRTNLALGVLTCLLLIVFVLYGRRPGATSCQAANIHLSSSARRHKRMFCNLKFLWIR